MSLLWIYDVPNWASLLLIVGTTLAVGVIGLLALGPWVSHLHSVRNHNEAVSYYWSAVVLFYGVMVGLIAVGVWEQFSGTDEKVALEASAVAALYRDVSAYPEPYRSRLQADLRKHTHDVIYVSWPLQRRGLVPAETNQTLWNFQADLIAFQPSTPAQVILQEEAFRTFNDVVRLRRMRLHIVQGGLPEVVWIVIGLGALITLSVGWFFKTTTFAVHLVMESLTAVILGLIVWLLVMLDHPFLGDVSIGPDAFEQVYTTLMTTTH